MHLPAAVEACDLIGRSTRDLTHCVCLSAHSDRTNVVDSSIGDKARYACGKVAYLVDTPPAMSCGQGHAQRSPGILYQLQEREIN